MNDTARIILFLTVCMTARLSLAVFAKILDPKYLSIMGIATLAISAGFFYTFLYIFIQQKDCWCIWRKGLVE
jgi:predicted membrane-bound dolichyl-phosphate-mannose-protein mannosyltransferase